VISYCPFIGSLAQILPSGWTTFEHGKFSVYVSSSASGGMLEVHSRFHDASPGTTIRCSPQCRVCSPRLSGLGSLSIVRSQDWWGQHLGWRQSTGRRSVDARSAREWSSEAAARAIYAQTAWGGVVAL